MGKEFLSGELQYEFSYDYCYCEVTQMEWFIMQDSRVNFDKLVVLDQILVNKRTFNLKLKTFEGETWIMHYKTQKGKFPFKIGEFLKARSIPKM